MPRIPNLFRSASLTRKLAMMLVGSSILTAAVVGIQTGWGQIDTTDPTVPEAPQQAAKPAVADGAAPPLRRAMGSGWSEFRA